MTFTIPEDVAGVLRKQIPARGRSRYVTEAIAAKLREEQIIRACEIANGDSDVLAIEREWETLVDDNRVDGTWNASSAR